MFRQPFAQPPHHRDRPAALPVLDGYRSAVDERRRAAAHLLLRADEQVDLDAEFCVLLDEVTVLTVCERAVLALPLETHSVGEAVAVLEGRGVSGFVEGDEQDQVFGVVGVRTMKPTFQMAWLKVSPKRRGICSRE